MLSHLQYALSGQLPQEWERRVSAAAPEEVAAWWVIGRTARDYTVQHMVGLSPMLASQHDAIGSKIDSFAADRLLTTLEEDHPLPRPWSERVAAVTTSLLAHDPLAAARQLEPQFVTDTYGPDRPWAVDVPRFPTDRLSPEWRAKAEEALATNPVYTT